MSYTTPKTNWNSDNVGDDDFNRIEGNVEELHRGNGHSSLVTVNPDAGGHLDINTTDECFLVTDASNPCTLILSTSRSPGNRIIVINQTATSLYFNEGGTAGSGYYPIGYPSGAVTNAFTSYSHAVLVFSGTYWTVSKVS